MKIVKMEPYVSAAGYGNESLELRATVEGDRKDLNFRFEERQGLYRAQLGDFVKFYYYTKPGNGYGGMSVDITMIDGSKRTLKGPWSSRAGCVNRVFYDRDHVYECVTQDNLCIAVTVDVVNRFGFTLDVVEDSKSDLHYALPHVPSWKKHGDPDSH